MSIVSMANVAYVRRTDVNVPLVAPAKMAPETLNQLEMASEGTPGSQTAVTTALKVIVTYIPTEVLTLYVAVLAAIQAPKTTASSSMSSRPLWAAFYSFLVATPLIVWLVYAAKVKASGKQLPLAPRTWPLWEMFAATAAYTAWAFALPDSPFKYSGDWYTPALAGVLVLTISTLLGLLAPLFQRPLAV
jgi:ABC-type arginine/histidine transport system permease subunit